MATILAYSKTTNDVVWSQTDSQGQEVSLDMVATALDMKGLSVNDYDALLVDEDISPLLALKMKVNGAKDGVYLPENISEEKAQAFDRLKRHYLSITEGIDPATGQRIYVDYTVAGQTIRMDAGRKPAETHDAGLRLAVQTGETTAFVVDFNNEVHYGVPLAMAQGIALQQALDARSQYLEYQMKKQQIAGATTVAQVRAIPLNFSVNIA